jgi:hypothetical protein
VSPVGNRRIVRTTSAAHHADYQSAIQPTASRRYIAPVQNDSDPNPVRGDIFVETSNKTISSSVRSDIMSNANRFVWIILLE